MDAQEWFEGQIVANDFTNVGFFLSDGQPNRCLDSNGNVLETGAVNSRPEQALPQ